MDQPISSTSTDTNDLRQELADLRRRTMVLYMALAVLSLTLAGFIGLQKRRAAKDLEAIRPQATAVIEQNRKNADGLNKFLTQLEAYGRANNDFQQRILKHYPINRSSEAAPAAAPQGAPVTAPR